jgi:hypothetical protein
VGLWTTPADLCHLACAVSTAWSGTVTDFLSQERAREMLTAQLGGWGLGWTVETVDGVLQVGHSGGNIGYRCLLRFWPELGLGAAVMTNADDGTFLVHEVFAAIGREYAWPDAAGATDTPSPSANPADLAACAGTWADDGTLRMVTTVVDDRLVLHLDGQPPLSLRTVGPSSFIAEVVNAEMVFASDDTGNVQSLTLRQSGRSLMLHRDGEPS